MKRRHVALAAVGLVAGCAHRHKPEPQIHVATLAPFADDRPPATVAPTTADPTTTIAPVVTVAPAPATTEVPVASYVPRSDGLNWSALARCESGGNPRATNGTDFGAFQFEDSTWHAVTGLSGHASDYPYATQLAAAQRLYAQRGRSPWPVCGRYL